MGRCPVTAVGRPTVWRCFGGGSMPAVLLRTCPIEGGDQSIPSD
jgi:hypothetical protein